MVTKLTLPNITSGVDRKSRGIQQLKKLLLIKSKFHYVH